MQNQAQKQLSKQQQNCFAVFHVHTGTALELVYTFTGADIQSASKTAKKMLATCY